MCEIHPACSQGQQENLNAKKYQQGRFALGRIEMGHSEAGKVFALSFTAKSPDANSWDG